MSAASLRITVISMLPRLTSAVAFLHVPVQALDFALAHAWVVRQQRHGQHQPHHPAIARRHGKGGLQGGHIGKGFLQAQRQRRILVGRRPERDARVGKAVIECHLVGNAGNRLHRLSVVFGLRDHLERVIHPVVGDEPGIDRVHRQRALAGAARAKQINRLAGDNRHRRGGGGENGQILDGQRLQHLIDPGQRVGGHAGAGRVAHGQRLDGDQRFGDQFQSRRHGQSFAWRVRLAGAVACSPSFVSAAGASFAASFSCSK
jgi:hypothetical protein